MPLDNNGCSGTGPRRDVIGTLVTIADYEQVLDRFDAAIAERQRIFVCCAPASTLVAARSDLQLRAVLEAADVVTPDGMGVVWAARGLGEQLPDRVYGPELMARHCTRAAGSGTRVWLYGGFDDDALAQLIESLHQRFPGLEIAGAWSPPHRALTESESAELAERINADDPDVVWVGIGSPRQEKWMHTFRPRLQAPVLCGVGAAFDFLAGRVPQAPSWMQDRGLEWLYRLSREPRRLGPRYFQSILPFTWYAARQALAERRGR